MKIKLENYKIERILVRSILIALFIFILSQIFFIFTPVIIFVKTVIVPLVLSGVLFYLLSPIRDKMMYKLRINKIVSIFIIYIALIMLALSTYFIIWPVVKDQVAELTAEMPVIITGMKETLYEMEKDGKLHFITDYMSIDEIFTKAEKFISGTIVEASKHIFTYVGKVSTFIIYLIVVPFMLYYMLKDGDKLGKNIVKFIKEPYRRETEKILYEMNNQLHSYVIGQITVYIVVGALNLIGFYFLGLDYALLLAVLFVVINFVPVVGVFFAATPAVIVALLDSPIMALKIIILVTIVNQLDSHFLSPQIMGKKLKIHPLTIIVLMLVSGSFLGVLGLIFALPVYVVLKVLFTNIKRLSDVYRNSKKEVLCLPYKKEEESS